MGVMIPRVGLVTAVGNRGSGKTTLCRALAVRLAERRPVLALDPWNEWGHIVDTTVTSVRELASALKAGRRHVRLCSSRRGDALALLRLAYEVDDCFLVLDEADLVLRNQHNPEEFDRIVSYGRHFGQSVLAIARRPSDLPRSLTAQGVLCFSHTREPNDRKWLRARLGDWPPDLEPYHWAVHDMTGEMEILPPSWAAGELARVGMGLN